jgi:hypothetical protein
MNNSGVFTDLTGIAVKYYYEENNKKIYLIDIKKVTDAERIKLVDARNKRIGFKSGKFKKYADAPKFKKEKVTVEEYKYAFAEKTYGIVTKINPKISINLVKAWGNTEGVDIALIRTGQIREQPYRKNDIRIAKVVNYADILLRDYTRLRYRPDLAQYEPIFADAKVDYTELGGLPDISTASAGETTGHFYDLLDEVRKKWDPRDVYYWVVEFILTRLELISTNKLGASFSKFYLDEIMKIEKFSYLSETGSVNLVEDNDFYDGPSNKDEIQEELEDNEELELDDINEDNINISD